MPIAVPSLQIHGSVFLSQHLIFIPLNASSDMHFHILYNISHHLISITVWFAILDSAIVQHEYSVQLVVGSTAESERYSCSSSAVACIPLVPPANRYKQ
jgi:hypothetical protein